MNKTKLIIVFLILLVGLSFKLYQDWRIKKIKNSPIKYAYAYFGKHSKPRGIVYIKTLKDADSIEKYYRALENYTTEPYLPNNLKVRTVEPNTKLFITEYAKDSTYARFHTFYSGPFTKAVPKHRKGWVKSKYLNDLPPKKDIVK